MKIFLKTLFQSLKPKDPEHDEQKERQKRLQYLKSHELERRDQGLIGGVDVEVQSNWIRLEVRDAQGVLQFEHEVDVLCDEPLISQAKLVGGRYLVIEWGDATAAGLGVWDFVLRKWSFSLSYFAEALLHSVHPSLPLIAIELAQGGMGLVHLDSNVVEPIASIPWEPPALNQGV